MIEDTRPYVRENIFPALLSRVLHQPRPPSGMAQRLRQTRHWARLFSSLV